jgi:hypothetical protein
VLDERRTKKADDVGSTNNSMRILLGGLSRVSRLGRSTQIITTTIGGAESIMTRLKIWQCVRSKAYRYEHNRAKDASLSRSQVTTYIPKVAVVQYRV